MEQVQSAVASAASLATALGLTVDDATVLSDSNRLVARLLPCDIVARVSSIGWFSAAREVELARCLGQETGAPIAGLDPRVEPRIFARDGFEISWWTHVEAEPSRALSPDDYAEALERLHRALRPVDLGARRVTDRLVEVQRWLGDGDATPDLADEDRALLVDRLGAVSRLLTGGRAAEQLLHGEPHPWNVFATRDGPLFFDFENCARGPVEFDLAWVPDGVSERGRDADLDLVHECRGAVLALVAAHRWRRDDQHPSGRESGVAFLEILRQGPPWPALDEVTW